MMSCTLVEIEDAQFAVEVVSLKDVEQCDRLGTTQASTPVVQGGQERDPLEIGQSLLARAKTNASRMGGDTVVAQGPVLNGRQTFVVFVCGAQQRDDPVPAVGLEIEKAI